VFCAGGSDSDTHSISTTVQSLPASKTAVSPKGATTFSKLGGPVSWSGLLLPSPEIKI